MAWLRIETEGGKTAYRPGEKVSGSVRWRLEGRVRRLHVQLFWHTEGKGTRDEGLVAQRLIQAPPAEGGESFSFVLPEGPYSFSGALVSLAWSLHVVTEPGGESETMDIVVSPTGSEVVLPGSAAGGP